MNNIRTFRFWCQKVLPLVYDDSLSYYELLCKVVNKLNEVITNENELNEAFQQLKEWVENYFSSHDFQEMVNNKLDEMAKDGTLASLINEVIFGELNQKVDTNANNISAIDDRINNVGNFKDILKQGGKSILFIGDSIGAGFGWWTNGDTSADRGGREGVMQVWKDLYPNNTYVNTCLNGCCLGSNGAGSDLPQIKNQVPTQAYDYVFIFCGINDVLEFEKQVGTSNIVGDIPVLLEPMSANTWDTAYNALYSLLASLRQLNPLNSNVYFCVEPTTDYNYFKYISVFKIYKKIVKNFGYKILDLYDIFARNNITNCGHYFYDNIHPNENGYRYLSNAMLSMIDREVCQRNSDALDSDVINIYSANIKNLGTEANNDFVSYKRFCLNAVPDIVRNFGDYYINKCVTLNAGNNNFIPVKIEHAYGEAWYVTFLPTKTFRFPCRFKYSGGITESEDDVFMSPTSNLASAYKITRICDIPISGIFYGSISQYTDLPSKWTGTLLCTIIAHVNIQVAADQPTGCVGYKWIEVVPYGSTERFYCRWIKNNYNSDALIDYFTDTSLQEYRE